jgi:hypothetical protein
MASWGVGWDVLSTDNPGLIMLSVPIGPLNSIADIFADPHFKARENLVTIDDPDVGEISIPGVYSATVRDPGPHRVFGTAPREHDRSGARGASRIDCRRARRVSPESRRLDHMDISTSARCKQKSKAETSRSAAPGSRCEAGAHQRRGLNPRLIWLLASAWRCLREARSSSR